MKKTLLAALIVAVSGAALFVLVTFLDAHQTVWVMVQCAAGFVFFTGLVRRLL